MTKFNFQDMDPYMWSKFLKTQHQNNNFDSWWLMKNRTKTNFKKEIRLTNWCIICCCITKGLVLAIITRYNKNWRGIFWFISCFNVYCVLNPTCHKNFKFKLLEFYIIQASMSYKQRFVCNVHNWSCKQW
jgi:hypothetical protein